MGRKIICISMSILLVFGLTACMDTGVDDTKSDYSQSENYEELDTTTTTKESTATTKKSTTTTKKPKSTTKKPTTTTKKPTTTTKKLTTTTKKPTTTTKKPTTTTKKPTTTTTTTKKPTTTTTAAEEQIGYARVSGEFTYKYNNFIGTRGDNGAKVMFIPMNNNVKTYDNSAACMFVNGEYKSGIVVRKCDGYGRFDTGYNVLPAGKYLVLVVSANTTSGQRFNDPEGWEEDVRNLFGTYFSEEDIKSLMLGIGYHKISTTTLDMEAGQEWTISDDFGTTYI